MPADVIIGAQWGDEGKGKIVDVFSEKYDVIVRYQGGNNAGHTVVIGKEKFVLHLLPSGIFHKKKINIIGNGVVIDLQSLIKEINELTQKGIKISHKNLIISENANIVLPCHKEIDIAREGKKKIGTTGRGIGPAYIDKYARLGIRMRDIFNDDILREKIKETLYEKNFILKSLYNSNEINEDEVFSEIKKYRNILKPYVKDTVYEINNLYKKGKKILFEGAQGALLDVDFGTYPYVTSSNPTVGGVLTGTGINYRALKKVFGVSKAYQTRVGNGPFPSEMEEKIAQKTRERGGEFGATTGRPRRCGWLDLVALKYACIVNGITDLIITKLDVLSIFDEIKVVTHYIYKGKTIDRFISDSYELEKCKPIFKIFKGWQTDLSKIKKYSDLPETAKKYLKFIKDFTGVKISFVSVGPERKQILKV